MKEETFKNESQEKVGQKVKDRGKKVYVKVYTYDYRGIGQVHSPFFNRLPTLLKTCILPHPPP